MNVVRIDHINIAGPPELIARCRAFYVDVLGLTEGPRPPFRTPGFWLYAGDAAIVHLSEHRGAFPIPHDGALAHYALRCEGLEAMVARLNAHAIEYRTDHVPARKQTQLFLRDPAGIPIELNFTTS